MKKRSKEGGKLFRLGAFGVSGCTALAGALSFACSSGGNDGGNPPGGGPDPILVAQFQAALAGEGVTPVTAPPAFSDELFDLGQALFFDKIISGNQDVSCATCHFPTLASADGRTLPQGVGGSLLGPGRFGGAMVPRHSPALFNMHGANEVFWDGRVELLGNGTLLTPAGADLTAGMRSVFLPGLEVIAAQAMFPPTSRSEMRGELTENELADLLDTDFDGIWSGIMDRLLLIPAYSTLFQAAYPGTGVMDFNFAHAANAIAVFEVTAFASTDSPFQRFVAGDTNALTDAQLEGGLEFFSNQANCTACHSGPRLTDDRYHNIGLPQFGPGKGDGPGGDEDFGREQVTGNAGDRFEFRTPSLLNIELTAPYGHLGQYSTLQSIVQHYRNPAGELMNYNILTHVTDPDLINTQVSNENAIIARLDNEFNNTPPFNEDRILTFLLSLTADSARDLSAIVPATVPSGIVVDSHP